MSVMGNLVSEVVVVFLNAMRTKLEKISPRVSFNYSKALKLTTKVFLISVDYHLELHVSKQTNKKLMRKSLSSRMTYIASIHTKPKESTCSIKCSSYVKPTQWPLYST